MGDAGEMNSLMRWGEQSNKGGPGEGVEKKKWRSGPGVEIWAWLAMSIPGAAGCRNLSKGVCLAFDTSIHICTVKKKSSNRKGINEVDCGSASFKVGRNTPLMFTEESTKVTEMYSFKICKGRRTTSRYD